MLDALTVVDHLSLPPEGAGTVRALSRIGYELEEALADIIDNSIDAVAANVEVTFFRNDREITAVTIADDGRGMTEADLHRGMRFAGRTDHDPTDLGTFGMGLKSASFSQCRTLTVVSRKAGATVACRWSAESIGKDWRCAVIDRAAAAAVFASSGVRNRTNPSGTLVIWDGLERLGVGEGDTNLEDFLSSLLSRLELHLGLAFHRFIQSKTIKIALVVKHDKRSLALPRVVRAYDPFGYPNSGDARYPKMFAADIPGLGPLYLTAHLWPPGSLDPGFLLGTRKGVSRQGFYVYRNDRLIQAGGWNRVVRNNSDPDLAFARVAIDLPPGGIEVNVQKSAIQVTAAQGQAFLRAKATDGKTLGNFIDDARRLSAAAKRGVRVPTTATMIPGAGLPSALRTKAHKQLAPKGPVQEVEFVWQNLPDDRLFELEPSEDRVILNKKHRRAVLAGTAASGADVPLVKMLIFLLFKDEMKLTRVRQTRRDWVDTCNRLLLEALR